MIKIVARNNALIYSGLILTSFISFRFPNLCVAVLTRDSVQQVVSIFRV